MSVHKGNSKIMTNEEFLFRSMIVDRINFLEDRFGLKKTVVARRLGIDYMRLYRWQCNGTYPAFYINKLAKMYGVSMDLLFDSKADFKARINSISGRR